MKSSTDLEPIAALASGSGSAAISILRVSGEGALSLLEPIIKNMRSSEPRVMTLCELVDPHTSEVIDEPMIARFVGPNSYTGQDSAEIFLHGGPYIVKRSLEVLYRSGFRPAKPGEFTMRAYLAGKVDLATAEGIKELAEASSHQQWVAARHLSTGKTSQQIESLRDEIMKASAWLEAQIDFPDEGDMSELELSEVDARVQKVRDRLHDLLQSYENGRVARRGLTCAIVGRPNAGKSTLLNCLLGKERAIVTDIAGTTRDYIEESCLVDGRLIRLIDTAGLRDEAGEVEKIGISSSLKIAEEADLLLFMAPSDASAAEIAELDKWKAQLPAKDHLLIASKADLGSLDDQREWVPISVKSDTGLDRLKAKLVEKVDGHISKLSEENFISNARHAAAIEASLGFVASYFDKRQDQAYEDMLAFELQEAIRSLEEIIGQVSSDDVLGTIFGSFCVGK